MRRRRLPALFLLLAVVGATVLTAVPASAGGGGGCHRPATEGQGGTLTLTELCFSPTVLRVATGGEVTIVNRDATAHPLSRPGGGWGWDGGVGDRTTVRLEEAGTYPFFCYAHPGMVGVVVVGDGRGTGAGVVEVAAAGAAPSEAAATAPAEPVAGGRETGAVPTGWLVLVAVCALVGAAAGTLLAARRSRG
jgi:plastocyanin